MAHEKKKDKQGVNEDMENKVMKRVWAWIALLFLLFLIVNILFIHLYVTESVVLFCFYVLFFFFGKTRRTQALNAARDVEKPKEQDPKQKNLGTHANEQVVENIDRE